MGVVGEKWSGEPLRVKMGSAAQQCGASQNTMLNGITRPVGAWGHHVSMVSRLPYSANFGYYKYWLMAPPDEVDWDDEEVLNRARLYRDRRDFIIQDGDSGMPAQYPSGPAHSP